LPVPISFSTTGLASDYRPVVFFKRPQKTLEKTLDETDVAADPGRLELLWLLRPELDDDLLDSMSDYDFGMDKEENLQALVEILRTGKVPCPLPPEPGEICNLMRWASLDPAAPVAPEERRSLIMRLFSTWILLNAYARPIDMRSGYDDDGDALALLNLVQIAMALGPDHVRASTRFVQWAQAAGPTAHCLWEDLFYRLCLLLLLCASPDAAARQAAPAACEALVAAEQEVRRQMSAAPPLCWWMTPKPAWFFGLYDGGLDGLESGSLQRAWTRTAAVALTRLESSGSGSIHPVLVEFKRRLAEQSS
jgi:hypothetical protein